jgi:hypothetical protein
MMSTVKISYKHDEFSWGGSISFLMVWWATDVAPGRSFNEFKT